MHLLSLTYSPPRSLNTFPFSVPAIRSLTELKFTAPVTFFVGENGSGIFTLLEALAIAARSNTVGAEDAHTDLTLAAVRQLSKHLRLAWRKPTRKGFFTAGRRLFRLRQAPQQDAGGTRR